MTKHICEGIHPAWPLKIHDRYHQKCKSGVSVAKQKILMAFPTINTKEENNTYKPICLLLFYIMRNLDMDITAIFTFSLLSRIKEVVDHMFPARHDWLLANLSHSLNTCLSVNTASR